MGNGASSIVGRSGGSELFPVSTQFSAMSDWKFDLDEVGPDGVVEDAEPEPVEPGEPTLAGSLFVLLGIATALYVLAVLLGFG